MSRPGSAMPGRTQRGSRPLARLPGATVLALVAGLALGAWLRTCSPAGWTGALVDILDVVGAMWVDAIRMTVVPLVVPLLVASIAGAAGGPAAARLGVVTVAAFTGLVASLAMLAALAAPAIFAGLHLDAATTARLRLTLPRVIPPAVDTSLSGWLRALIPANPIKALADGQMLSVVVFAVAFGFAALAAPPALRMRVRQAAQDLSEVMLVMVRAVLLLAPAGVFALALVIGARVGGVAVAAVAYLLGVELAIGIVFVAALFGATMMAGGLSPRAIVRGAGPAVMVAAGTSSSLSALPAMIEGARDEWRLPDRICGFVLPFAVATFKPTSAYSWVTGAYFVARLYGVPFGDLGLLTAAGYAILFNAAVPGIPGGGIAVAGTMFVALGLPLEGLAILLAVNPLLDRLSTIGNVAADMAMTAILAAIAPASSTGVIQPDDGQPGDADGRLPS